MLADTAANGDAVMAPPAAVVYEERRDRFTDLARRAKSRRNLISHARLAVFVLVLVTASVAVTGTIDDHRWWWVVVAALSAGFVVLVIRQREAEAERARYADLARINGEAIDRIGRAWGSLPPADFPLDATPPPVVRDIDLFGRGSVFQLLGTGATLEGRRTLAGWLIEPATPEAVQARQDAVRELAPLLELRQEVDRLGRRTPRTGTAVDRFRAWTRVGETRPADWHPTLARTSVLIFLILLAAHALTLLPPLWIGMIPLNALLWIASARRNAAELAEVELRADDISRYAGLFEIIEDASFQAEYLRALRRVLVSEHGSAHNAIQRLRRIVRLAEVRYSPIAYIPLQLFTLWDTHIVALLDRWRSEAGSRAGDWFDALGEFESLAALAGLAFDNPDWIYPTLDPESPTWEARGLAHPLLHADERVANDVRLGPPGTFLLVTGSNMSGKSTLLRAIGVNTALAQTGAPVCAAALSLPPTRLGTSFVVEDSLQTGVSFFMAELQRIRSLIDAAGEHESSGWRYLFLLDEVLKGTNSGERQIAVRRILEELLDRGAIGAISTHDLALADAPDLRERSLSVHFREHFEQVDGESRMGFDYRMRPGPATTTNALALLRLAGIAVPDAEGDRCTP